MLNKRKKFLFIIYIFVIFISSKYFIDNDEKVVLNKLETSNYVELNPFIIRDGGIGPKDYTWSEAAMQPWCSGGGTKNNPYIISNIKINGQTQERCCIYIVSSTVFFKIKDCEFYNSRHVAYAGIKLSHVSNGKIINTKCFDNTVGIRIEDSDNINIINNHIFDNEYGILMFSTTQVNILSNNASNNHYGSGISVSSGDSYNISNNIVNNNHYGLFLGGSNNILVSKNNVKNNYYGIGIYDTFNSFFITNTILNSYTGIDFMNSQNNLITSCEIDFNSYGGGLYMYESFNNNITFNKLSFNNIGIHLTRCDLNRFEHNTIISNYSQGITLFQSSKNIFFQNFLYEHSIGIYLYTQSNNNTFHANYLANNGECIRLDSTCLNNIFTDNRCVVSIKSKISGFNQIILLTLFGSCSIVIVVIKRRLKIIRF